MLALLDRGLWNGIGLKLLLLIKVLGDKNSMNQNNLIKEKIKSVYKSVEHGGFDIALKCLQFHCV